MGTSTFFILSELLGKWVKRVTIIESIWSYYYSILILSCYSGGPITVITLVRISLRESK